MPAGHFSTDDPLRADVSALLRRHLEYAHANTAPEDVFALDVERLADPAIAFFSFRDGEGRLLAVGALKHLDGGHAEIKSMHTAQEARRRGIGRAMVAHLLDCARERGYTRVSLETGSQPAFAPARALYEASGFEPCVAFADYRSSDASVFMTIALD
ncbi:MAG TPA: GNAT family N-acetyltransferase [Solirubrobacteraceae bacterium]|nr:GNAT family N-acetyltransferase [Solirubrobacteraceae bacterium]